MPSMFRRAVLTSLSDDELEDLALDLGRELAACNKELPEKREKRQQQAQDLTNSGVRFGAETVILVGGLIAAPLTGGLSIIVAGASAGLLVWDGSKLARKAGGWRKTRRETADLLDRITEIEDILEGIAGELESRP